MGSKNLKRQKNLFNYVFHSAQSYFLTPLVDKEPFIIRGYLLTIDFGNQYDGFSSYENYEHRPLEYTEKIAEIKTQINDIDRKVDLYKKRYEESRIEEGNGS